MHTLLLSLIHPLAQNGPRNSGFPNWLIFLILLIILVVIIWYISRPKKEPDQEVQMAAKPEGEETAVSPQPPPAKEEPAAKTVPPPPEPEPEPVAAAAPPPEPEPEPVAPPPPPEPAKPDNLKKIEGIGPKIERILNEAGITTFSQLANASVAELNKIVREDAGITIAYPDTWPKQAKLAAQGDWAALESYQNALHGGREIK